MSRSRRTMRSPSTRTRKLTGSLSAGCCGPMGNSTSGMPALLARRFPILPQRVFPLGPSLVEEQRSRVGVTFERDPQEVMNFPLVEVRGGEDARDRWDVRCLPRQGGGNRESGPATGGQVVDDLEGGPGVDPAQGAQMAAREVVPQRPKNVLYPIRPGTGNQAAGRRLPEGLQGFAQALGALPEEFWGCVLRAHAYTGCPFRHSLPPPLASSSMSCWTLITPSTISSGLGGHPATHTSTGTTLSTPPTT